MGHPKSLSLVCGSATAGWRRQLAAAPHALWRIKSRTPLAALIHLRAVGRGKWHPFLVSRIYWRATLSHLLSGARCLHRGVDFVAAHSRLCAAARRTLGNGHALPHLCFAARGFW